MIVSKPLCSNFMKLFKRIEILDEYLHKFLCSYLKDNSLCLILPGHWLVIQFTVKSKHDVGLSKKGAGLQIIKVAIIFVKNLHRPHFYHVKVIEFVTCRNGKHTVLNFLEINAFKQGWDQVLWHFVPRFHVVKHVLKSFLLSKSYDLKDFLLKVWSEFFKIFTVDAIINIVFEVDFDCI